MLSEGCLFGGFLSSAQVTRALFSTDHTDLVTQIPTGIPTGPVPTTHEDQCNAIQRKVYRSSSVVKE